MGMRGQVVMFVAETPMVADAGHPSRVYMHSRAPDVRDSMAEPMAHFGPDPVRLFDGGVRPHGYMRFHFQPVAQPARADL